MLVSALWGVLFLTNSLRVWEACVPSAVRLNATFRSLGVLFGPVVGSVLLLGLGPVRGIFTNIAIYLPLTLFLFRTKFTGHLRDR